MAHYENATVANEPDLAEQSQIFQEAAGHHDSISSAMERYGGDLSKCPYLQSLGSAGVALVEQLQAAEKDPNRGPTIAEVLAAKKAEREAAASSPELELVAERTIKQEDGPGKDILQAKTEAPAEIVKQAVHAQQKQAFFSSKTGVSQNEATKGNTETTPAPLNPVIIEFQTRHVEERARIDATERENTEKFIGAEPEKTTPHPVTKFSAKQQEAPKNTRVLELETTKTVSHSEKPVQTAPDISAITPSEEVIRKAIRQPAEKPLSQVKSKSKQRLKPQIDRANAPNEIVSPPPVTEIEDNHMDFKAAPSRVEAARQLQKVEAEFTLTANVVNAETGLPLTELSTPESADRLTETIIGFFEFDPPEQPDKPSAPTEQTSNTAIWTKEEAESRLLKRINDMEKPEILAAAEIIEKIQHISKNIVSDQVSKETATAKEEMVTLCKQLFRLMNVDIEKAELQTMITELVNEQTKSHENEGTPSSREKGTLEQKIDAKAKITHYLLAAMHTNRYFSRLGKLLLKDHVLMVSEAI